MVYSKISDEELTKMVVKGDNKAFDELYNRYKNQVYRFIKKQLTKEASEDIVQNVFLRLFKGIKNFNPDKKFSTYLYTIAVNETKRFLKILMGENPLIEPLEENGYQFKSILDSCSDTPENYAYKNSEKIKFKDFIDKLPRNQRMVIILKVYHDLTFEDISKIIGIPISTALSRMRYGLQKLRNYMEKEDVYNDVDRTNF